MPAAAGTVVTAVDQRPISNIAKNVRARIVQVSTRQNVLAKQKAANFRITKAIKTATTRTTIADAIGMVVTAVPRATVVPSIPSIARLANVWTLTIKVTSIVKGFVSSRITKGMVTATTRTTIAAASGTVVTAVQKLPKVEAFRQNTASNASA